MVIQIKMNHDTMRTGHVCIVHLCRILFTALRDFLEASLYIFMMSFHRSTVIVIPAKLSSSQAISGVNSVSETLLSRPLVVSRFYRTPSPERNYVVCT